MSKEKMLNYTFRLTVELRQWLERYATVRENGAKEDRDWSSQYREDLSTLRDCLDVGQKGIVGRFTTHEACLLVDALSDYPYRPGNTSLEVTLLNLVVDSIKLKRLDKKWNVEKQEMIIKLTSLSYLEALAVIHLSRLFWVAPGGKMKTRVKEMFLTR